MNEGIEQLDSVAVFNRVATFLRIGRVIGLVLVDILDPIGLESVLGNDVQNLDFIVGSLSVV